MKLLKTISDLAIVILLCMPNSSMGQNCEDACGEYPANAIRERGADPCSRVKNAESEIDKKVIKWECCCDQYLKQKSQNNSSSNQSSNSRNDDYKLNKDESLTNSSNENTNNSSSSYQEESIYQKRQQEAREREQRERQNQDEVNRLYTENQRRIERQDREAQQLLNNWENKMQTDYQLYSREYDSYENFKSRTSNLASLNASTYRGLISEFNSKITQLDREYSNREREVNQQISNRMNAAKTGEHDWVNDVATVIHQQQAQKKLKEEKQQAENKLRKEKEEKKKVFVDRFKTDVARDRNKALDRAKYAINKDEEIYYIKLYTYFDCLYKDPYGALNNNSYCNEPQGQPAISNKNYSGEDLYQAYNRKKNSTFKEIRDEAEQFLEMAIQKNPNNPQWLYEKALTSNNTSEKLGLLNKAVKLEPNNTQYKSEQLKAKKKRYGEMGEVGDKVNGKKHGKWVEYWSNGDVKQVVNYSNGIKTGNYAVFFDSDWKETNDKEKFRYYASNTYDKNGVKSLETKKFYKSGKIQMMGQYQDEAHNIKTGEFTEYYESGELKAIELYKDGKLDGVVKTFSETGVIISSILFEQGEIQRHLELRDTKGNPIKSEPFTNGLARVKLKDNIKMGYINEDGFVVIPIVYDWVDNFRNGVAIVKKNDKYGGVNKNGKEIIPIKYDELKYMQNGEISARKDERTGTVDKNGKESLSLRFDFPYAHSKKITFDDRGFALVKKEGKFGFIDEEGNTLIDFKYDNAFPFFDKEITRVGVEEKREYGRKTNYGYINRNGVNITSFIYEYAYPFKNGFGWVQKNGLMTFVNEQGKEIIEPTYSKLLLKDSRKDEVEYSGYEFNEFLARVKKNNKYGYVDTSGNIVIEIIYNEASHFYKGEATVYHSAFGSLKINGQGEHVQKEKTKINKIETSVESEADIVLRAFKERNALAMQNILSKQVRLKKDKNKENLLSENLIKEIQIFLNNHPYELYASGVLSTKRGKTVLFNNWLSKGDLYDISIVLEFENERLKITQIEIKKL